MAKYIKVKIKAQDSEDHGQRLSKPQEKKVMQLTNGHLRGANYSQKDIKSAGETVIDMLNDYGFDKEDLDAEVYYKLKDEGYFH